MLKEILPKLKKEMLSRFVTVLVHGHSYIISSVTGTYGSRTLSDINVCAHTSNRKNENLANIIGANSTNFRLLRINGTRY